MPRFQLLPVFALLLGLTAPSAAHGQAVPITGVQMVDIPGMVLPDVLHGGSLPDARSPDYKAKMAARNGTAASKTTTSKATNLAYVPTAALRQQTVQSYVSRLRASNPGAAQALTAEFGPGKHDYSQIYRSTIKDTGLRENDAADALATFMILGWMIVNNQHDGNAITVPMAQGVRAQVAPSLATSTAVRAPGAAARLGEELKLQVVVLEAGWLSAPKEGKEAEFRQGVASLFRQQYGFDLSQVKLTSQGFAPK